MLKIKFMTFLKYIYYLYQLLIKLNKKRVRTYWYDSDS